MLSILSKIFSMPAVFSRMFFLCSSVCGGVFPTLSSLLRIRRDVPLSGFREVAQLTFHCNFLWSVLSNLLFPHWLLEMHAFQDSLNRQGVLSHSQSKCPELCSGICRLLINVLLLQVLRNLWKSRMFHIFRDRKYSGLYLCIRCLLVDVLPLHSWGFF